MKIYDEKKESSIREKYESLLPLMNERLIRMWAAAEAVELGAGGKACVARATGLHRNTIDAGIKELSDSSLQADVNRIRHPGAGRTSHIQNDPSIIEDLQSLVESTTRGDPSSPLLWTTKSVTKITVEMQTLGHQISTQSIWRLLVDHLGYTLQATAKEKEGSQHPGRDEQFQLINHTASEFLSRKQPVISVDAKKKELVGNYANSGAEWNPKGKPIRTMTHDFPDPISGKAAPYGIYDIGQNEGWVNVGVSHDTAEFAVNSIHSWWQQMGRKHHPEAKELYITADAGGSNGHRNRLWKVCLQNLANRIGLRIVVSHFPPGTSKWNKIEHRLFSEITKNWRGRPLSSYQVIVNCISNTTTEKGLRVKARLDSRIYEKGIKIEDEQLKDLELSHHEFQGNWNYWFEPQN